MRLSAYSRGICIRDYSGYVLQKSEYIYGVPGFSGQNSLVSSMNKNKKQLSCKHTSFEVLLKKYNNFIYHRCNSTKDYKEVYN